MRVWGAALMPVLSLATWVALRGADGQLVFALDDPMAESTCVACGECVQACPTGALSPKTHIGSQ